MCTSRRSLVSSRSIRWLVIGSVITAGPEALLMQWIDPDGRDYQQEAEEEEGKLVAKTS